jgi:hypothetical protein
MIELNGEKRIKIESEDGYTHVYVGGKEVRRVREISFHQSVDEFPVVKLEVYSHPTIETDALVDITYSPDEYLEWLDRMVEEKEGDEKIPYEVCRAHYLRCFGR